MVLFLQFLTRVTRMEPSRILPHKRRLHCSLLCSPPFSYTLPSSLLSPTFSFLSSFLSPLLPSALLCYPPSLLPSPLLSSPPLSSLLLFSALFSPLPSFLGFGQVISATRKTENFPVSTGNRAVKNTSL